MSRHIEFNQPNRRREDWRVVLNGRTVGSVWRAGEGRYLASCSRQEEEKPLMPPSSWRGSN